MLVAVAEFNGIYFKNLWKHSRQKTNTYIIERAAKWKYRKLFTEPHYIIFFRVIKFEVDVNAAVCNYPVIKLFG